MKMLHEAWTYSWIFFIVFDVCNGGLQVLNSLLLRQNQEAKLIYLKEQSVFSKNESDIRITSEKMAPSSFCMIKWKEIAIQYANGD